MRDGSGIYTYPPGTPGVAGQTIFSARYNTFLDDLATTLNTKLPINMGGTNATDGPGACDSIGAVKKAGDTMTGTLVISPPGGAPVVALNKANGSNAVIAGYSNNQTRWQVRLGNSTNETGSGNSGSDFDVVRFDDSGTVVLGVPFTITRANGNVLFANNVQINGGSTFVGGATFSSSVQINGGLTTTGSATFQSGVQINGGLTTTGSATFQSGVQVNGTLTSDNTVKSNNGLLFSVAASNPRISIYNTAGAVAWSSWVGGASDGRLYFGNADANGMPTANLFNFESNTGAAHFIGKVAIERAGFNVLPPGISAALLITYLPPSAEAGISFRPSAAGAASPVVFKSYTDSTIGSISAGDTNVAYNTSSDGRLKEDLKSFDAGRIIDDTMVYDFAWKSTGERSFGVIGQQAIEVYPTAVTYSQEEDWYGVDYSKYVPVLLQELKALRVRVAQLEGKVQPA